jgi:hypothetical protein
VLIGNRSRDLSGMVFGRLTVLEPSGKNKWQNVIWKCRCICGIEVHVLQGNLVKKKGFTISCGCYQTENRRKKPYEALYNTFARENKRREVLVDLSYEDFIEYTATLICHYCNGPIRWQMYDRQSYSRYNLDRKDNSIGYSKENCVVCCKRCNIAKSSHFTYEEWYGMTEYLRANQAKKVASAIKGSPTTDTQASSQ